MEELKNEGDMEIYVNVEQDNVSASHSEVYENFGKKTATAEPGCESVSESRQVRSGNPAAVGLGLLCVLLLAVIMGLSIKHNAEIQQIQNRYTNITLEKDQLQTSYDNLTIERDGLQSRLSKIDVFCPSGWKKFMSSCYYISYNGKTWDQSQTGCKGMGADLVIINSEEEQTFVSGLAGNFWIGLTDRYWQGQWTWVDGSSLTSKYWMTGEPNNYRHWNSGPYSRSYINADCVQITRSIPLSNWKNVRCDSQLAWICEMKTQCQAHHL